METTILLLPSHLHPQFPPPLPAPPWKPPHFLRNCRLRSTSAGSAHAIRTRRFDFNPPSFDDGGKNGGNFNKRRRKREGGSRKRSDRRWWSDEDEKRSRVLDGVIDSVWILKVFKSYGWFLPPIIISLLTATGPKAFLMASSIPFGLSLITLAFNNLWEWLQGSPKPRKRRKRNSPFSKTRNRKDALMEEEEDDQDEEIRNQKRDYRRSRVASNRESGYGGWD